MHTEILEGTVIQKKIELWAGVTNNTRATIVAAWAGFQYVSINSQESQAYMCACKYIRICVRVYTNIFLYMCACVCVYVCMYVCIYVCMYVCTRTWELLCHCLPPPGEWRLFCQVIIKSMAHR